MRLYRDRSTVPKSNDCVGELSGDPEWASISSETSFPSLDARLAFLIFATTTRSVLSYGDDSPKRKSEGNANTGALCLESSRLARSRKCVKSSPFFVPSGKHSATPIDTQRAVFCRRATFVSFVVVGLRTSSSSSSPSSSDAPSRSSPRLWNSVTSSGSFASSAAVTARVSSIFTRLIASSTTPASVPSTTPPLYRNRAPRASFAAAAMRSLSLDAPAKTSAGSLRRSTASRGPESPAGAASASAASSRGVAKHAPIRLSSALAERTTKSASSRRYLYKKRIPRVSRHNRSSSSSSLSITSRRIPSLSRAQNRPKRSKH
mmetsp:Transcript_1682/g.6734  ORF Transcript_1682/g.6734 Transcript_1682/m.6734 type:complete len:319 (+) Transcript_1682:2224-3180(+)